MSASQPTAKRPPTSFIKAQRDQYSQVAPTGEPARARVASKKSASCGPLCRPSFDEFNWEGLGFFDRLQFKLLLLFDWYIGYARITASGWWLFILPVPSFWIGIIYLVLRRSLLKKHNLFQAGGARPTPATPSAPHSFSHRVHNCHGQTPHTVPHTVRKWLHRLRALNRGRR